MTGQGPGVASGPAPPALLTAVDIGSATAACALLGRIDGRLRLLAATVLPVGPDVDELADLLARRVRMADPGIAETVGLEPGAEPVALVARTASPPTLAVATATERTRQRLEAVAAAAGWLTIGQSAERHDPLAMVRMATRTGIAALLVGTADPPEGDERDLVEDLVGVADAVAARRPGMPVVLAGAVARSEPADGGGGAGTAGIRPGTILGPGPGPVPGGPAENDLRAVLLGIRAGPDDGRRALARVAGSLARVLGRRVEILDIGAGGALRAVAAPDPGAEATVSLADVEAPLASFLALDAPGALDGVEAWSTLPLDRARLRDRLAELHFAPWSDLAGDGPPLRGAALRAGLERLLAASDPVLGVATPDLLVATGAFGAIPAPAVALVLADVVRRPGVTQLALDAARLLAPLGTIVDEDERDQLVAELADDLLLPLGTLIMPRGVRAGRSAGRLTVDAEGAAGEIDLVPGGLSLVDLPPGQDGLADLQFRSAVDLGAHGRRFVVPVAGGLAGLLVDLRDLPDGLPNRPDERRERLASWERALWPERLE